MNPPSGGFFFCHLQKIFKKFLLLFFNRGIIYKDFVEGPSKKPKMKNKVFEN